MKDFGIIMASMGIAYGRALLLKHSSKLTMAQLQLAMGGLTVLEELITKLLTPKTKAAVIKSLFVAPKPASVKKAKALLLALSKAA